MIYEALDCVVKELNAYLLYKFGVNDQKAILNAVLNQDGSISEHCLNKVVVSLVNLEHDTTVPYNPIYNSNTEKAEQLNLPYNFNLDVLITALFENSNYDEGLKFLSESIFFFHYKPLFTHENTPELDIRIEQLGLELIRLTYHEEHSLWGAMGAKYMPSVLFKIRLLSFQSGAIISRTPAIRETKPVTKLS